MAIFATLTMKHFYKGKAKYIFTGAVALLAAWLTLYGNSNSLACNYFHTSLTNDTTLKKKQPRQQSKMPRPSQNLVDTPPVKKTVDTTQVKIINDTTSKKIIDTIVNVVDTFNYKISNDTLDAPVTYSAEDSMVLDVPAKKILLYGKKTTVTYGDNNLEAPRIEYDQSTNYVSAYLVRDSLGEPISLPTFKQADFLSVSDSIRFDMKSGKGLTKGTYTKQDEMFVYGEKIKKVSPDVFYAFKGRFTTCNLDTPHFSFVSKKIKFINKKMAFTGPVHPEIEDIPLPITLPFGIYPMSQGRHGGVIAPSFNANAQLGLSLDGLGYYAILNDHWDGVVRGTLYSYGGWTGNISPRYFKRYKYQGNFNFNIQRLRDIDGPLNRSFNVTWSHSMDSKARPGVTFTANVNAGSSKFNEAVPNNNVRAFTNQMQSSITYSKIWKDKSGNQPASVTVSANHSQNTRNRQIDLNLPNIAFNVNTLYPFRKKEQLGELKWFENLGVALNSNVRSLSFFYDTASNIGKQLVDRLQWGARHSVPITLSLPSLGPIQIAPSISYDETWYQNKVSKQWNSTAKKVDTTITKGFYTAREMNWGASATTRIFGMIGFRKDSKVQAIRHEIRPSIGFSYHPDMNGKDYQTYQIDTSGTRFDTRSKYEGNIEGAYGAGQSGSINFSLDNNIQMKVRNKKDTTADGIKKVTLIDGFTFQTGYDLLRDTFQLAPIAVSARTNIFEKVSINAGANFYPYQINSRGDFIDKLVWRKKPFSLGTLTSANIAVQTSFKGGDKNEKLPTNNLNNQQQVNPVSGMPYDEYQQEAAYINRNPGEFANFNIPWSVSLQYSFQYNRERIGTSANFRKRIDQNINWNGTLNLTSKWQLGLNGFYNITTKELGSLSMYLTREMHCWQMAINISPVGRQRFFNITINPKSGILRDLKINRTRYFYDL
jgi:LPS-assembly protein